MSRHHDSDASAQPRPRPHWGLRLAGDAAAARIERAWRLPVVLALAATIPAFYADLLDAVPPAAASLAYLAAAVVTAAALATTARRCRRPAKHLSGNPVDLLLVAGLMAAALLPGSEASPPALGLRLAVSLLVLVRMLWAMQHLITRGGLTYLLVMSLGVLALCGAGFWWLEPTVNGFGEGLWLAFTTAATVGYGDIVPTTPASRIFAVFVVLLGFGVLTMVTAAIATTWIETEERRIEREILHDLRSQISSVRNELAALRAELRSATHLLAQTRAETRRAPRPPASKREPP
ncbi:MAG: potassium channel family protein [Rubrivivax sp.]